MGYWKVRRGEQCGFQQTSQLYQKGRTWVLEIEKQKKEQKAHQMKEDHR
jgi:hypothetical protein